MTDTTTTRAALERLIDAVEAGEITSIAKDYHLTFGGQFYHPPQGNSLTADRAYRVSLDAAKALHDELLPGWDWDVTVDQAMVSDATGADHFAHITGIPARSWLLADATYAQTGHR